MSDQPRDSAPLVTSRETLLAAKLRENLHRRKAQARGLADAGRQGNSSALPKPPRKS